MRERKREWVFIFGFSGRLVFGSSVETWSQFPQIQFYFIPRLQNCVLALNYRLRPNHSSCIKVNTCFSDTLAGQSERRWGCYLIFLFLKSLFKAISLSVVLAFCSDHTNYFLQNYSYLMFMSNSELHHLPLSWQWWRWCPFKPETRGVFWLNMSLHIFK